MKGSSIYTGIGHELDEDAAWDYIRNGYLLSPRTVLKGRTKLPQSIVPPKTIDLTTIYSSLQQTLEAAIGNIKGMRRAVMFSGGFDSLLICLMAQRCGAQIVAITVQFDDFNPMTVQGAIERAKEMGLEHHILSVKTVEFLSAFETLAGITDEPVLDLDLAIVFAALKKYDHRVAGDVIISGMGSDQWFGNIALEKSFGSLAVRLDWAVVDEAAHQQVAQVHGCKFVFPFLSKSMLALSQSIPPAMKKDKQLLRSLAVANSIPNKGVRSEVQIPGLMRRILIKTYGDRAWPCAVSADNITNNGDDQTLRQIILGIWLEKAKERMLGA